MGFDFNYFDHHAPLYLVHSCCGGRPQSGRNCYLICTSILNSVFLRFATNSNILYYAFSVHGMWQNALLFDAITYLVDIMLCRISTTAVIFYRSRNLCNIIGFCTIFYSSDHHRIFLDLKKNCLNY